MCTLADPELQEGVGKFLEVWGRSRNCGAEAKSLVRGSKGGLEADDISYLRY